MANGNIAYSSWKILTNEEMTSLFLYGTKTPPPDLNDRVKDPARSERTNLSARCAQTTLVRIVGVVLSTALMSCGNSAEQITWREEVRLDSKVMITVFRSLTLGGPSEIGQPPSPSLWLVEFSGPHARASNPTRFESRDGEQPMVLDFEGEVPYVATYLSGGIAQSAYGCPNPPYRFYRHVDSGWQNVLLEEFPQKFARANLAPDTVEVIRRAREAKKISWAEKVKVFEDRGLSDAVKAIRRPSGNRTFYGQFGCPERG